MLISLIIPVFKRAYFTSPSKELSQTQPLLLWQLVWKNFQRPELDNLVKRSLKLIYLNNKKDKIDGKANIVCLLNLNMQWTFVVLHQVLVSVKEKCQGWEEIDYLSYLPFSIYILTLCMSTWNAVWSVLYLGSFLYLA